MKNAETEQLTDIAEQFALDGTISTIEPFGSGRINDTYLVRTATGTRYVLQQLNPIFSPTVLDDIDAVTRTMKKRDFITTELIPAKTGELSVIIDGACWRMLSYIEGRTIEEGVSKEEAKNAMELIGHFHHTFSDHDHQFHHVRDGFHDTPRIMGTLGNTVREYAGTSKDAALAMLARDIANAHEKHPHAWAHLPKR